MSVLFLLPVNAGAQGTDVSGMEKEALVYFQQKEYAKALPLYNKLLVAYPRDPKYNYYAGVSMVELGQEPEKAIYRLKIASLKQVPEDVFFYLGRACYQAGKYDEAVRWYGRFREKAPAGKRKDYHLEKYITEAEMARDKVATGEVSVTSRKLSSQEQASVTSLAYRHRADSLEMVIAGEKKRLATTAGRAEKEQLQKVIASHEQELSRYREQAGIWAVRAGEGGTRDGKDYTLFGTGDGTTRVLAPAAPVSEEEAAPFLELAGEDFYKSPGMRKILSQEDYDAIEGYRQLNKKGNGLMKEAWKSAQEASRQQMVVNTSSRGWERNRAESRIRSLEKEKEAKRLQAVQYFQKANDGEYELNNKYIESLLRSESVPAIRKKQGESFRKEADRNYGKALQLRDEAAGVSQTHKYDKLMEANAYELMALDNQRKAMATLAGLMPATDKDMTHVTVAAKKPQPRKKTPVARTKKETVPVPPSPPEEKIYRRPVKKTSVTAGNELEKYPFGLVMTPAGKYRDAGEIPAGERMPAGVNYRLQIGVFSKEPDLTWFRGMYPLFREEIAGKDLTRYYAGQFRTYGEAAHALLQLRKMGYDDAIVVGFYNGKRSSVSRIRSLEDEKPYVNIRPEKVTATSASPPQKAPLTVKKEEPTAKEQQLIYRVQVGVFRNPLPKEKLNALEELAGWDHVVIRTKNNQGYYIYAIGNFATFDEAKKFRNRLAERGMSGCFVTAYKNGARILIGEGSGK